MFCIVKEIVLVRSRLLPVICLIVTSGAFVNCGRVPESETKTKPSTIMREFKLKTETIRIDESEMETIRQVVAEKLASEDGDINRVLRKELLESIVAIGPEDSRFGPWALTDRDDHLALVRIPPRSALNYIFVASLAREKGRWIVTDFFQERMKAR